jgi:hypothetical protein
VRSCTAQPGERALRITLNACPGSAAMPRRICRRSVVVEANLFARVARVIKSTANNLGEH